MFSLFLLQRSRDRRSRWSLSFTEDIQDSFIVQQSHTYPNPLSSFLFLLYRRHQTTPSLFFTHFPLSSYFSLSLSLSSTLSLSLFYSSPKKPSVTIAISFSICFAHQTPPLDFRYHREPKFPSSRLFLYIYFSTDRGTLHSMILTQDNQLYKIAASGTGTWKVSEWFDRNQVRNNFWVVMVFGMRENLGILRWFFFWVLYFSCMMRENMGILRWFFFWVLVGDLHQRKSGDFELILVVFWVLLQEYDVWCRRLGDLTLYSCCDLGDDSSLYSWEGIQAGWFRR